MAFITGAGITNIDLLYQGAERIPDAGEEVYCRDFDIQLGGGLPATLINLGRLGIETKIATELGDDIFSNFAKSEYEQNGVSPVNLYRGEGIPLNISSSIILPRDRSFISYGKGNIEPDDRALEEFYNMAKGAKICLMQVGGFNPVYRKLKDEGTILVLDTGWDDNLSFDKYADVLELADYYTPNRKEAVKITGESTPDKAAQALSKHFEKVVVKLDSEGCLGIDGDGEFFVKSVDDFKCVDSTGAGDAFLAGFCYGLFGGYSLRKCIELGNITGGKSVTAAGALSAYLSESELLELHKKYY